jgi:hypothetical protein
MGATDGGADGSMDAMMSGDGGGPTGDGGSGDAAMGDECTEPQDCDDGNVCTADSCENGFCVNETRSDGTACDAAGDGNEDEICVSGECAESRCGDGYVDSDAGEECDDGNNEIQDGCEPDCTFTCTEDADCDDGNICTADSCTDDNQCENTPQNEGDSCQDGDGTCQNGSCLPTDCTIDADCSDGNPCTTETCNNDMMCESTGAKDCDDGDECTADSCVSSVEDGCVNTCIDNDGDGFVSESLTCAEGSDCTGGDCNDEDPDVNPDAVELCGNDTDDDCDGMIDEGGENTWYADCDGDGFAASDASSMTSCNEPSTAPSECSDGGWTVTEPTEPDVDCNDANAVVNPDHNTYESEPIANEDDPAKDFDYNCDGNEEKRFGQIGQCVQRGAFGECQLGATGWSAEQVPDCGSSGEFLDENSDCVSGTGGATCSPDGQSRTQRCR